MPYSDSDLADIEAVLLELTQSGGFESAEERIAPIAPQLQQTLDGALSAGGWFDDAHESMVLKAATAPDEEERLNLVRHLVLEQTRLGMLVGVAVGWELAERLADKREPGSESKPTSDGEVG
ncbi:MAG: hypothetical protein ACRDKI_11050 [Solirubrobacterales bacterium]